MARKRLTNEAIIAALLSEGSIKGAAARLGCGVRTIYSKMKTPAFNTLYSQAKMDLVRGATTRLQGNLCGAVDTLSQIMTDTETAPQTRANCASLILQYGAKFTETTDVLERLTAIEEAQEGGMK